MIYILVSISIATMSAAQLFLKKGMLVIGESPHSWSDLLRFLGKAYSNIYVIAAVVFTIITALVWVFAVSKSEISYIYPFMALSYLLVVLFSIWLFHENVTILRLAGTAVICLGVFLVARS